MTNPKHTDTSRSDLVEAMARAIYEADDPWHVAWPWPDLQSDQAGADHYRRCAEAAAAVIRTYGDERHAAGYQAAIADVVEWLESEATPYPEGAAYSHAASEITRRFGKGQDHG